MKASIEEKALDACRRRLEQAKQVWPHLKHAFVNVGVGAQGHSPLRFYTKTVVQTLIPPLTESQSILEYGGTAAALALNCFCANDTNDLVGLRLFKDLAFTVCRCLRLKDVEFEFSDSLHQCNWWTDIWLSIMHHEGATRNDPFLHVIRRKLRVDEKIQNCGLAPGYSKPFPKGDATGVHNRRRRWKPLLIEFEKVGLLVRTLDQGVFRASAYAIERIVAGDWGEPQILAPPLPGRHDIAILAVLNKAPQPLIQEEIIERMDNRGPRGRRTIGTCLRDLENRGHTAYPNGRRRGAAIAFCTLFAH